MSIAAVKIKLMPSSAEASIEEMKNHVSVLLEKNSVKNPKFEVQPIAFGLKALVVLFGWPEEKELESLEESFKSIEEVGSVEVIDIRRAIG